MSRTTRLSNNWIAIHNQSPSEDSEIIFRNLGDDNAEDIILPFGVTLEFVLEQVKRAKIKKLEEADALDVLNM